MKEKILISPNIEAKLEDAIKNNASPFDVYLLMIEIINDVIKKSKEDGNEKLGMSLLTASAIMLDFAEYVELAQDKMMHNVNAMLHDFMSKMSKTELPKNVKKQGYKN